MILPNLPAGTRAFKEQLKHFLFLTLPVPFVFVSAKKLMDGINRGHGRHVVENEKFTTLAHQVLYRSLLKAGSLVFIPQKTPIVELTPTMIIGIVLQGNKQFSIVASLKKEFDSFYSNSGAIKQESHLEPKKQWFVQLASEFENALEAFKQL